MRLLRNLLILALGAVAVVWYVRRPSRPPQPVAPQERPLRPAPTVRAVHRAAPAAAPPAAEPAPRVPPPAGRRVVVELIQRPLEAYAAPFDDGATGAYARVVAALGRPDVVYDPHLGRAATDVAYQHSFFATTVPSDVLEFLLRASGAIDRTVTEGFVATNERGTAALRKRLEEMLRAYGTRGGEGPILVGIGEAWVPGAPMPRFLAILLSRRGITIEPAPRQVPPGATFGLTGTLPPGYRRPTVLALFPGGEMRAVETVRVAGERFELEIPVGMTPGVLEIALAAEGPFGPTPLLQLPVGVGRALPLTYETTLPPAEEIASAPEAEERALALLNEARASRGLARLGRDLELDRVARDHSADMRDGPFFGHRSPRTGDLRERLAGARYRASTFAENLALAPTIHEAHAGLWASLGHRRNLLSSRFTRVGVGVVESRVGEERQWLVTQVLARPAREVDPAAEAERILTRLNEMRRAAGLEVLRADPALERVARTAALRPHRGSAVDPAAAAAARASWAWRLAAPDPDAIELPREAAEPRFARVGVGVAQEGAAPAGLTHVVLVFGR